MSGWSEATLMAWIKIDPTATGDQIIFGQNSFYIQLNSDKTISAKANGNTVSNNTALNTNQWTHVAASYSNTNSALKLFINGQEIFKYYRFGCIAFRFFQFNIRKTTGHR